MLTVIIKDADSDDCEITRIDFACKQDADDKMDQVMNDFFAMYGSGSCGFYGVIEGWAISTGEFMNCQGDIDGP